MSGGRKARKLGEWRRHADGCGYAAVSADGITLTEALDAVLDAARLAAGGRG